MGLDQHFYRETYVRNDPWNPVVHEIEIHRNGVERTDIDRTKIVRIVELVGSLHRAWAVHEWLDAHVSTGIGDCAVVPLSIDDMGALLADCRTVMLHPKQIEGLFGGGLVGYDFSKPEEVGWAMEGIAETEKLLAGLNLDPASDQSYSYKASW